MTNQDKNEISRRVSASSAMLGELFKKHLLRLTVDYVIQNERKACVFSGFMLKVGRVHLLVTAGHVVKELKKTVDDQNVEYLNFGLADNCDIQEAARIPFDFPGTPSFSIFQDGVDIGFIEIKGLALSAIDRNPQNEFLDIPSWQPFNENAIVAHFMMGFPKEGVKPLSDLETFKSAAIDTGCYNLPVKKIPFSKTRDPNDFWDDPDAFFGELQSDTVECIVGMSGGPIFAVSAHEGGRLKYHLVAIQSRWLPESRIIKGTSIRLLVDPLVEAHNEIVARSNP